MARNRRTNISPAQKRKIVRLLKKGNEPRAIARELGVHGNSVRRIGRKADIPGLTKAASGMGRARRIVREIRKLQQRQVDTLDKLDAKYEELYGVLAAS